MSTRTTLDPLTADPHEIVNSHVVASHTGIASGEELLDVLAAERSAASGKRVLLTLDNIAQCHYTSMHALEADELYVEEPDDFDEDDPAHMVAWERATTAHVAAQLLDPDLQVNWDDLAGRLDLGVRGVERIARANARPTSVLDRQVQVLNVDVAGENEVIAGLVNGYFTSDLNVFANHAVVRRMARHGYRLFGLGASWLGFERDTALEHGEVAAVLDDLRHLCGDHADQITGQQAGWDAVAAALAGQRWLFVGYTENYAD